MTRKNQTITFLVAILFVSNVFADKQLRTEKEKFSYAIGVQLSQNLLRQSIQVEVESFSQAVSDVLKHKTLRLSPEELQQALITHQQQQAQKQSEAGSLNKIAGDKFLAGNKTKDGVAELPSGLQYKILRQGDGEKPSPEDAVVVNYEGTLIDGKVFDSSYERGQPASFPVNGVIKGWQEILIMMPVGSKWQIYVPSKLAYGDRGAGADIGPNSTLIFDIELISIK